MERAIIHSNLKKEEIQPDYLVKNYQALIEEDIQSLFPENMLKMSFCPVTNEKELSDTFSKFGMKYNISHSLGNIYLSPRPSEEVLKQYYHQSKARHFWLSELWPLTKAIRSEKIILPQLEWVQGFMTQYFSNNYFKIGEFIPNHWGYACEIESIFPKSDYFIINPLYNSNLKTHLKGVDTSENVPEGNLDAVLLFEALDRTVNPRKLLEKVNDSLKPGGLCFITCLLSSGFEIQLLRERSSIFMPPERMNILSFEGMSRLIEDSGVFELLEFSTPGVLDIPNVIEQLDKIENSVFFKYVLKLRKDPTLVESFQDFLQLNRLGTFGRLVLKKNKI